MSLDIWSLRLQPGALEPGGWAETALLLVNGLTWLLAPQLGVQCASAPMWAWTLAVPCTARLETRTKESFELASWHSGSASVN